MNNDQIFITIWNRLSAKDLRRIVRLPKMIFALFVLSISGLGMTQAAALDRTIVSKTIEVNGVKLHYMTAGHGIPLILLHGYAETSRMWKPIIPLLAKRFTVIAPDLPGIGDSAIPKDGLDMKSAAIRIHALARLDGGPESGRRGPRYRSDGCVRLCGAIPCGSVEASCDGCLSPRRG